MALGGLSLELAKRVLDRGDQWPVELEQVCTCASGQDDAGQCGSEGAAALGDLVAQGVERDGVAAVELGQSHLDGSDCAGVGENLGRLLERLVLVDRYECGSGPAVARHEDVVAAISDVVQQFAQPAAELSHGYVLGHTASVRD
jgi:hypothetical protein